MSGKSKRTTIGGRGHDKIISKRQNKMLPLLPLALRELHKQLKAGEIAAIKLVIERCVPPLAPLRPDAPPMKIKFPTKLTAKTLEKLKDNLVKEVFEGRMEAEQADKIIKIVEARYNQTQKAADAKPDWKAIDPMEASRIYMEIMNS